MLITAGVDVGTRRVKAVLLGEGRILALAEREAGARDAASAAREAFGEALRAAEVKASAVSYVAATGWSRSVEFASGRFGILTCLALGGHFLSPGARWVLDVGALRVRAVGLDGRGRPVRGRVSPPCRSGGGLFLERVRRMLGVGEREASELAERAAREAAIGGACAVLAETDVVNALAQGASAGEILQGLYRSLAARVAPLAAEAAGGEGGLLTGGLSRDGAFRAALAEALGRPLAVAAEGPFAAAIGAARAAAWRARP